MTVPAVYQIETTNACNLTCSFCPLFEPWNERAKGFMDPDLIDRVDWSGTNYTELQFTGEPTLHKRLQEIIERVKAKGVRVGFSTNGTFKERLGKVLPLADAVTVNDDDFRDPVFADRPNVLVQQLGVTYEIEDYSRTVRVDPYPSCTTPVSHVSIHWNGDVVPCCKDHSGVNVFGNLYSETFDQIANGAKRAAFLALAAAKKDNGLCEWCCAPNPHEIHSKILKALEAK